VKKGNRKGAAMIMEESTGGEKWNSLQPSEGHAPSGSADTPKFDETKLPSELINDFQGNYTDEQQQNLYHKILKMGIPEKLRLAILGNREARNLLIRDPNKMIALAVLKNAKLNENEVLKYAQRRDLSQDIILAIAQDQKWKKNYSIKIALASNPKTPLSVGITFLPHLNEKDLKLLSRDKNVSSVLNRRAHEILVQRNSK
jgi:hypothetical protein